jgi:hypothetical protein
MLCTQNQSQHYSPTTQESSSFTLHPIPHTLSQGHVRLNPPTLTLQNIPTRLLRHSPLAILLIPRQRRLPIKVLINHPRHAHLAVIPRGLRAIVPKRVLVLHLERKNICRLASRSGEIETGEDAGAAGERLTGLVERGLHDGVVLGEVVEFDQVADFGYDICGG